MAFSLFKKKAEKSTEKTDDRYQELKVADVVNIAKDAINIIFEKPNHFEYQPGQFITIIRSVNGKKIRRAYSLNSTPFEDENPSVTVKRVADGLMSNDLNETLEKGDSLEIMNPMGLFTTSYSEDNERTAVFYGGGSGITPLISILRSILIKEPKSKVVLLYANRSEEYIIFKDLLKDLNVKYGGRMITKHILENGDADYSGRITTEIVNDLHHSAGINAAAEHYICGPQPMMDVVADSLKILNISDEKVRMESFEAGKTSPSEIIDQSSDSESEVTIVLDGEEYAITVKKGASVLDTALDNELDMPYSCQSGLCTACRGKCIEGNVTIDDAEGLSQEELDEGYVLTCVGKPISDRVKIEMG